MDLVQMKSKKDLYQAEGSEHYLIFIELGEKNLHDKLDRYNKKNTEQKEKNC